RQTEIRDLSNRQGAVKGRFSSAKRLLMQIDDDIGSAGRQSLEVERNKRRYEGEIRQLEESLEEDASHELDELRAALQDHEQDLVSLDKRRQAGRISLQKITEEVDENRRELERLRSRSS